MLVDLLCPPGRLPRRTAGLVAGSLALYGLLMFGTLRHLSADPLGGYGVDTQATIVGATTTKGDRFADVEFLTAGGTRISTRIAICHHQAYDIGTAVPIRYDSRAPARAWEKDMAPVPAPALIALVLLSGPVMALIVGLGALQRRRGQGEPAAEPVPATPETVQLEFAD